MTIKSNNPKISVGIITSEIIEFRLIDRYSCNKHEYVGNGFAHVKNDEIVVLINDQEIAFGKEIYFNPEIFEQCQFELKNVIIGVDFHWEQKENQVFQGSFKLMLVDNKILAINILPIEHYLTSVISSEMNANSSPELLKAHTIISRSWLLAQIQKQDTNSKNNLNHTLDSVSNEEFIKWYDRKDHKLFNVCADDHCQRYQGITRAENPNVAKAVSDTFGMVLTYNNEICDARFSKCCGGVSEQFENCWESVHYPYLTMVVDNKNKKLMADLKYEPHATKYILSKPNAFCNTTDENILSQVLNDYDNRIKNFYRWQITYSQHELSKLILKKSGIDFGEIQDLLPVERGTSGRLIKLKIVGTKKKLVVGKELEIRRWLSESHLYSSAFIIEKKMIDSDLQFIINGAGWGHGVGLCQIGAAVMGEQGYNYKKILKHYYKGAEITKYY